MGQLFSSLLAVVFDLFDRIGALLGVLTSGVLPKVLLLSTLIFGGRAIFVLVMTRLDRAPRKTRNHGGLVTMVLGIGILLTSLALSGEADSAVSRLTALVPSQPMSAPEAPRPRSSCAPSSEGCVRVIADGREIWVRTTHTAME
ncbi:hypothetical protein [Pelagovum pacificum]|uniref:Uncharacterized protein n=1 Tax=Pelagovum pacificum TaxID=2588711 RepID=A0A5C5GD48_9RHOB|nr:hypothetical protein [Pelagovum pacificum]QQA44453.1 hypothetical protein I8N54_07750 [Pelagovum pacificum]TNY32430.1 hypothetical protein FHY64_03825 [Pelagovum pacificum]